MKRVLGSRKLAALAFVALVLTAAIVYFQIRKVHAVLDQTRSEVLKNQSIPLEVRSFSVAPNPTAKLFNAPYEIRDLVHFEANVYAATSNGLVVFSSDGKQIAHWTPLEGFPSGDLTAIVTLNGNLWIGTSDNGLIQYSKQQWTHFLPKDVRQRSIHSLLSTQQGALLAGTSSGLIIANGHQWKMFLPQLRNTKITAIGGDGANLCIGTFANGLYTYSGGVARQYTISHGLMDSYVTHAESTPDGCYVSTPSGAQILEKEKFRTLAKNVFVTSFAIDNPILWIATRDRGVIPINTQQSAARPARKPELERRSPSIIKMIDSTLLAAAGSQISYLEKSTNWEPWNAPSTLLSDTNISSLLRMPNGEIWIGYFDNGLDVLSATGNDITHYSDETLFCVNHLSRDQTGRVYVSTSNGLVLFHPDRTRKVYRIEDGLLSDRVMQTLPLDPEGKVVAIATTQGFTLKDGETMKSLYAFHGLVNNHVYTMASAKEDLYLGTLGGISRVSNMQVTGNWTQMDSGLKRNWVNALMHVGGQLFVGTYGSGVQVRTEDGQWRDFPALPQDLEINPNALFFDGKQLLFGTLDRGFYIYDLNHSSWKHIARELPGLNVTAFAADGQFLYVGTDRGLLQMQYDKLRTIPDIL